MREPKILSPFLLIAFVVAAFLSPASAQELPEISGGLLCAPNPKADKRNTEARAGCIECDAQIKNSKLKENLKPIGEIVRDLKQESEKDKVVRELTTLNLILEDLGQVCDDDKLIMRLEGDVSRNEKQISFIEKNQPDFKNIFNDDLYGHEVIHSLLFSAIALDKTQVSGDLSEFISVREIKTFNQIPEEFRALIVQGLKKSHQKTTDVIKEYLQFSRKSVTTHRACQDAVEKLRSMPEVNEPEKLTLENAKEGLSFKEQIAAFGFLRNRLRPPPPCGLTTTEDFALYMYSESFYRRINSFLRTGEDTASPPMSKKDAEAYTKTLNKGLTKLNNYKGLVNRGTQLSESALQEYEPGKIVTHPAYTSTSRSQGFNGNAQFVIQSKTGKYIAPLAVSYTEEEVLLRPETRFLVKSKTKVKDGQMQIELEEVVE